MKSHVIGSPVSKIRTWPLCLTLFWVFFLILKFLFSVGSSFKRHDLIYTYLWQWVAEVINLDISLGAKMSHTILWSSRCPRKCMYLAEGDTFLPPCRQNRQVALQESTALASISMCTCDGKQFWFLLLNLFKNICSSWALAQTSVSAKLVAVVHYCCLMSSGTCSN